MALGPTFLHRVYIRRYVMCCHVGCAGALGLFASASLHSVYVGKHITLCHSIETCRHAIFPLINSSSSFSVITPHPSGIFLLILITGASRHTCNAPITEDINDTTPSPRAIPILSYSSYLQNNIHSCINFSTVFLKLSYNLRFIRDSFS